MVPAHTRQFGVARGAEMMKVGSDTDKSDAHTRELEDGELEGLSFGQDENTSFIYKAVACLMHAKCGPEVALHGPRRNLR